MRTETKVEIKERMKREGRWGAYVAERDRLGQENPSWNGKEIREAAVRSFPPLNNGHKGPVIKIPAGLREESINTGSGEAHSAPDAPSPTQSPQFFSAPVLDPCRSLYADRSDFDGKPEISEAEAVRWVAANMFIANIRPIDAPSAGAWSLYAACQDDQKFRSEFYRGPWTKLLPTRSEIDANAKFGDESRELQDTISRVEKAQADSKIDDRDVDNHMTSAMHNNKCKAEENFWSRGENKGKVLYRHDPPRDKDKGLETFEPSPALPPGSEGSNGES